MANTVNAVSYLACMYNWNNCSLATSKRSVKNKITQKIKWNQHNFFPSVLDSGDDFFLLFIILMVNLFICLWMFNFYFSRHQEWCCWNVQLQTFHAFMWAFGRYLYIGACLGGSSDWDQKWSCRSEILLPYFHEYFSGVNTFLTTSTNLTW